MSALGFVSLVGAGPGDPDLMTVKAVRRLQQADLVLYDALVTPKMLALAPRAQRFFVGKRARRKAVSQETIHQLMIRAARRGRRVVRLKAGDPFVLGRGGEEALALRAAGIPFEVVPGVSSAIAAPGLAGIPVTHRGLSSGFAVVSGHAEEAYRPMLEAIRPNSLTLVVLMGIATRAALARFLIERGWRPATPAAIVSAASTPQMTTWTGRLDELGTTGPGKTQTTVWADPPGTIVIGDVVSLRAIIAEKEPSSTLAAIAVGR
jgi:uroporphyrin-III C-methyltransferase/precorrin-2 dehydrogenase/sirohydrochlorin ferrochelatase